MSYLSFKETQEKLSLSHTTVLKWLHNGKLKGYLDESNYPPRWIVAATSVERQRQELIAHYTAKLEALSNGSS